MLFERLISSISSIKSALFCNVNISIFKNRKALEIVINPRLELTLSIIQNMDQLERLKDQNLIKDDYFKLKYFLQKKCRVFIAMHDGKAVGRCVLCEKNVYKPYLYLNHNIFNECRYYIFFCRTEREYQGMGVFKYILKEICLTIKEDAETIYISASPSNKSSCKGIASAGFVPIGRLRYFSLFRIIRFSRFY